MKRGIVKLLCACAVTGLLAPASAWAQDGHGSIVAWGSLDIRPDLDTSFMAVAAGAHHSLGLNADGSIVAWGAGGCGQPYPDNYGQSCVPAPNADFVAVAADGIFSLGLKADGSVVEGPQNAQSARLWRVNWPGGTSGTPNTHTARRSAQSAVSGFRRVWLHQGA